MTHQATVPARVAAYFGGPFDRDDHPVIAQAFKPGRGWTRYPIRKRVSGSWLRKMRAEGYTEVALACRGRLADFTITEALRTVK